MPIPRRFHVHPFWPKAVFQPMDQKTGIAEQRHQAGNQHQGQNRCKGNARGNGKAPLESEISPEGLFP